MGAVVATVSVTKSVCVTENVSSTVAVAVE